MVCAWLQGRDPSPWQVRHLLEPICREGRLPGMGSEEEYRLFAARAGFELVASEDLSRQVRRTWTVCSRRLLAALATRPSYLRFLLRRGKGNRVFALAVPRILLAYRTGAMRYCLMTFRKPGGDRPADAAPGLVGAGVLAPRLARAGGAATPAPRPGCP